MAAQQQQEATDIVTTLQEEVKTLSQMLYTLIGALQRDAPAKTVAGEPVLVPGANAEVFQQIMDIPGQMIQQSKTINDLIRLLPEDTTEESDMAEIVKLQQESNELSAQLSQALVDSEDKLLEAQALFEKLGKHQIHVQAVQAAGSSEPWQPPL